MFLLVAVLALAAVACADSTDDATAGQADADTAGEATTTVTGDDTDAASDPDASDGTDNAAAGDDTEGDDDATTTTVDGDGGDDDGTAGTLDPALTWTVIGVAFDDTLNVRADPDASALIVGELDPWSTDFAVLGEEPVDGLWARIELPDATRGWVNRRFIVGQPDTLTAEDEFDLTAQTRRFIDWANGDLAGDDVGAELLAERALWSGGIGIYADVGSEWNWIDRDELTDLSAWDEPRDFNIEDGFDCGADCVVSLRQFLTLDRNDDTTEINVNDIPDGNQAFLEGLMWQAPPTLHRVVVDTPTTDPQDTFDWQRLHVVHDWSTGEPRIHLLHNHGWTP
ncbi:MAG: SH3 domain-containing protein [Actinomycetota bacterium]